MLKRNDERCCSCSPRLVGEVLSSVAAGHPGGTRSALDRFSETSTVDRRVRGDVPPHPLPSGERLFSIFSRFTAGLASSPWCSWPLAVAVSPARGVVAAGCPALACPGLETWRRPAETRSAPARKGRRRSRPPQETTLPWQPGQLPRLILRAIAYPPCDSWHSRAITPPRPLPPVGRGGR
jgi:hypothetical protein